MDDIEITGSQRAIRALRSFLMDDSSVQRLAPDVFRAISNWQKKVFKSQGRAATGSRWRGYSGEEEAYEQFKRAVLEGSYPTNPLLRWASGNERLFPSLTRKGAKGNVARTRNEGWEWGTDLSYAHKHQRGVGRATAWGKYKIRQRQFINDDLNVPGVRDLVMKITELIRKDAGL